MKKRKSIILTITLMAGIGIGSGLYIQQARGDIWSSVGDFFSGLADNVKDVYGDATKFAGQTFSSISDLANYVFNQIAACINVVPKGTEWASKKAAYEVAKKTLEVAQDAELANVHPSVLALKVAEEAAEIGSIAMAEVLKGLSAAAGQGVNVRVAEFKAKSTDLTAGLAPDFHFEGTILGQDVVVDIKNVKFWEPAEIPKLVEELVNKAVDQIKGDFTALSNQFSN